MNRPEFEVVLGAWLRELTNLGRSAHLRWAFRENLALLPGTHDGEFGLLFQTESPAITEADVASVYARHKNERDLVLQLLAGSPDFSLCTLLFDAYESEEGEPRKGLGVYFDTDPYRVFKEATAQEFSRVPRSRRPSGLDFVPLFSQA